MAQPSSISLTILRKGDTNLIDVAERGTLIPRSETRIDDAFLREVSAEIMRLAAPEYSRSEGHAVVQELQRLGGVLFSHLLTEPARRRLRAAESCERYLRLDEALLQVPWELSYDGEQFLVMKFHVGRQVITSAPLPSPGAALRREVATIRTLTAYREVMTALIQQHYGRVVDTPGDNLLAEFASAVDAVQGAVEIRQTLKTKNADLPPNRKMEFRIGINGRCDCRRYAHLRRWREHRSALGGIS